MKKYLLIILIVIISLNVEAKEEIIPIRNKNNFIGVEDIITIDSTEEIVKIESIAVKGLLFYTSLNKNDKYKIKFKISTQEYMYIKDSIKINKYKYNNKMIYRTINSPLKKLYNYKNINLEDKILDKKLKDKGYKGIEELDEYYKDYYNCDKLTYKELKKIIKGKQTYIKENNKTINKLAYDYYYKNIFNVKVDDLNIELSINNKYYTNAYLDYPYDLDISLYLKKIE
jgi:hypothetical protein